MLLRDHPQPAKVSYVLSGLKHGFSLEYEGERSFRAPDNLPSAQIKPQLIRDRLAKEIQLGRMWGPFNQPPFKHLMCSPVGLVPKKDTEEMRMIMHLSYPYGESINDFIDKDKTSTSYQQFDDAIRLVQKFGQGCFMAKGDVKSAFKLAPMRYKDLECLGIFFQDQFYIDLTLPFGSSISCAIFEDISSLIHWIFEQQTKKLFLHYLDDYFMCDKTKKGCWIAYKGMQNVAANIGLPLSPDKLVPPTQCISFLGMGIDSIRMLIVVPQDKKEDILKHLQTVMQLKKTLVRNLQSLAGKLNFITKAVPQGRAFSARIYWTFKGMKPTWHTSVTKELKKDLQMWIRFLQNYGGCTQIPQTQPTVLQIYTDASANPDLGWGAWCGSKWMWGTWDKPFFHEQSPSIDFLELYAVVVAVFAWTSNLANKHVVVFSDNTPTVAVINDKLASSPNLMYLIRFFVLHCMLNNITVQARYLPGKFNKISDALSRFQFQKFHELHPSAEDTPTLCPTFLYPLCGRTFNNLQL